LIFQQKGINSQDTTQLCVCHLQTPSAVGWFSSVLRSLQHSIGYMGDGFYRSKDPTNSIKVLKEKATKKNSENANNKLHAQLRNSTC